MANVLVPNIIITNKYDVVNKIGQSAKLDDVRASLSEQDSMLLQSDRYVYELIHSLGYNSKNEAQKLLIKVYDVDGDLEDKLFNQSLFRGIATAALDRVKQGKDSITTADTFISKELNRIPSLYITYGVNEDFRHWCSPKIYNLINAKLNVSNNMVRSYEFEFMPTESPLVRTSSILNIADISELEPHLAKESFGVSISVKKEDYTSKNIQIIVTRLIREYLYKAFSGFIPKGNIIVLLPKFIDGTIGNQATFTDSWNHLDIIQYELQAHFGTTPPSPEFVEGVSMQVIKGVPIDFIVEQDEKYTVEAIRGIINKSFLVGIGVEAASPGEVISDGESPRADLMKPLNNIVNGILKFSPYGAPIFNPILVVEGDVAFAGHLKKFGLIDDPQKQYAIFTDSQMLSDFIYCNQAPQDDKGFDKGYPESLYTISPTDPYYQILVTNKEAYRSSPYFKESQIKLNGHSSGFREQVTLDELAVKHPNSDILTKTILDITSTARRSGYPIFTSNLKNSNVLSYTINGSNAFYYAALNTAVRDDRSAFILDSFREEVLEGGGGLLSRYGLDAEVLNELYGKVYSVDLEGLDPFIPVEVINDIIAAYSERSPNRPFGFTNIPDEKTIAREKSIKYINLARDLGILESITTEQEAAINIRELLFRPQLRELLNSKEAKVSEDDVLRLSQIFTSVNNIKKGSGSDIIMDLKNLDPNRVKARVLRQMQEASFQITIKTLPMFHISSSRSLMQPCLFYAGKIKLQDAPRETDLLEYFSGEYRIYGFNHVISSKDCYSEFLIMRIGQGKDFK